jgi:hypothetical protein
MCRELPRAGGTCWPGRFALQFQTIGEMNPLQTSGLINVSSRPLSVADVAASVAVVAAG